MAGESPDRSEQRESSAEPTSRSTGPVPEARDPRVAAAREKDSSAGGTDTATKVLTVRTEAPEEPKEPAGTDDSPEDPALRAAVSAWVRDPETDATAKSGKTDAADAADPAAPETGAKAGEPADSEGPSDANADDEGDGHGDGDGEKPEKAADAGADADSGDNKAEVGKAGAGAAADAEADADAHAEDETDGGADGRADAEPDADAKSETDAKPDAKSDANAKSDAEADAKKDADAGDETRDADETHTNAKADTEAKTDTKAKTGPKADAKAKAEAKADADTEDTKGGAGEGAAGPAVADGGDDPQGPPTGDDESRTGGAGGKTHAGDGEAGAADGTPDTGGAQRPGKADAVDQPTTAFKAVQPKKPAVDQPTTMLKLGGEPKAPRPARESDAERTSKFVALKDDMRPAGKAPAGKAPAPKATPADATTPVPQIGPERTTRQPLPPKPPLDLLAELTNTPPPPETPVRTLVRRVKIWTPLVLLLVVILGVVQAVRPLPSPSLALTAKDGYTFEGGPTSLPWPGEGQGWIDVDGIGSMGHFGEQKPVAIGSVAKTMTAYIILRDHPLKAGQDGPKIKVDAKAEKEGGYDKDGESTLNTVKAGQSLTEKEALSAVMIPSANNIARLLARWDAGSEAAFVKKMNATARQLGMTGTTYTDPSGLKETTVSTAGDQVKLGRAAVRIPALVAITSAASWTDPSGRNWPNYNELPYRIGAIGIKTGSTTAAGGNLLFASRKKVGGQTVTLVGAILGQNKPTILKTVNEVSKTALLAAQSALTSAKILKKGDVVGYVDDGLGGHTPIAVTRDVTAAGWSGLKVRLSFAPGTVPHTAKAGTVVGTLTVGDGSAGAVKVPVALRQDLAEPGLGAKLTRLG